MQSSTTDMSATLRDIINQHFFGDLQSITTHLQILSESLVHDGTNKLADDLAKVRKGQKLLSNALDALVRDGVPEISASGVSTLSNLRHELRTPLNAIMGYTELFSEKMQELGYTAHLEHCSAILEAANGISQSTDLLCSLLQQTSKIDLVQSTEQSNPDEEISQHLQRITLQSESTVHSGHILVVDDVEDNRTLLHRYLTPEGHTVSIAESGVSALSMIEKNHFDIILLDIMMPDMNGLQVLEHLKASETHRQIPIIVISGLSDVDAVTPCIAAGAEDYLTKPFNSVLLKARISACLQKKKWDDKERAYLKEIETEKARSEAILSTILPSPIIKRLKSSNDPIADRIENVTILFADIVGFTPAAERMTPEKLLERLDVLFSGFDELTQQYGVEKIKTIGDAYMAACGVPLPSPDHIDRILDFACAILRYMEEVETSVDPFQLRIGIHTGPVVAGLVGRHRYVYDLWGETVNLASRVESSGEINRICVTKSVVSGANARFQFESLGNMALKGIGHTPVFTLKH